MSSLTLLGVFWFFLGLYRYGTVSARMCGSIFVFSNNVFLTIPQPAARDVYLPAGAVWHDFWTHAVHHGGQTISKVRICPLTGGLSENGRFLKSRLQSTSRCSAWCTFSS